MVRVRAALLKMMLVIMMKVLCCGTLTCFSGLCTSCSVKDGECGVVNRTATVVSGPEKGHKASILSSVCTSAVSIFSEVIEYDDDPSI